MRTESNCDRKVVDFLEYRMNQRYCSVPHGREHIKPQCDNGYSFGMTVRQTWKSSHGSMEAVAAVANVLFDIAEWSAAGSIAWEMRRFIRRATPTQTVKFAELILVKVRNDAEQLREYSAFLNMDDVYWETDWGDGNQWTACQSLLDSMEESYRGRIIEGSVLRVT